MTEQNRVHTTIRMTVVSVFILATLVTAAIAIGLQYYFSIDMARKAASDLYTSTSQSIASELKGIGNTNANIIQLLAENPDLAAEDREAAKVKIFTQVLERNPLFYGIYVGDNEGNFFEVINLDTSEEARRKMLAVPTDKWLLVSVRDGVREYQYLDRNLQLRTRRQEQTDFISNTRPWFTSAFGSGEVEVSAPYLFSMLGVPGRTVSKRVSGSETVVGIDMTLTSMSEFLASHDLSDESAIYLFNTEGLVVASSEYGAYARTLPPVPRIQLSDTERAYLANLPTLKVSNELDWPPLDYAQSGQPRGYSIDVMNMLARMLDLRFEFVNGLTWTELVEAFKAGEIDLLHSVALTDENREWGLPGEAYATMPFALLTAEGQAPITTLDQLAGRPVAIGQGWSILDVIRKHHPDVNIVEVQSTLAGIEKAASGEVYAVLDNEVILRYIVRHYFIGNIQFHSDLDLGVPSVPDQFHVLVNEDRAKLRGLLDRAISALGAEQRELLEETWLNFDSSQASATSETVPAQIMVDIAKDPERQGALYTEDIAGNENLIYVTGSGGGENPVFVGIVTPEDSVLGPFLNKVTLSILITTGLLLALLPLSWFFANPIVKPVKQLALENDKVRRRDFDAVKRVPSRVKELDELSDSMVSMVSSIQAYEEAQRELMDSFIRLIAEAIDEKSPYTGGHCERVPELALMLAAKASDDSTDAFREFHLDTEEQWREYRIAAWLHDCGKITTPEHIVDKGSKLETIYNRVHEVRMRFEALWRDAEISYWEQLAERPEDKEQLKAQLSAAQAQLQDDYEFVAECNVGGEFLDEDKQARLRSIAEKTWTRYFDNRIGLSPVEELRVKGESVPTPAVEPLLADKEEHIIERTRSTDYDPKLGINMDIPEHLYNQGEIYNLSISRGTLTAEDRFKINEHMISTIRMLESLPFPDELKNVPRYASTHHETMRGSGYPRKLPGEQLSIPERILAVADVFEALTASDRPYKKAKPISVAIDILGKMVDDNHIDRDCFELFLTSGVYMDYAQAYLEPFQVDEVDINRYLRG